MKKYILAVDDNTQNFNRHNSTWENHGIIPIRVASMQEAVEKLAEKEFIFIGINGDSINYKPILSLVRGMTLSPVCVFVSSYSFKEHIDAIQNGADYYIQRQLDSEETTKWNVVIIHRFFERNHYKKLQHKFISYNNVLICPIHRKVFIMDREIILTRKEFDLLYLLMTEHKRVFTYEHIFKNVWGEDYIDVDKSALWNLVKRLRKKVNILSDKKEYIVNVHDIGYAFDY